MSEGDGGDDEIEYVTLISSDGFKFVVDREAAIISETIKSILNGPGDFKEKQKGEINFREISGPVLERVVKFFYYKKKYINSLGDIPAFPIEPEYALELLMASNFLSV